jgi:hypothetical protein
MADHRQSGAILVHGAVSGEALGIRKRIDHAWIEEGGMAYDLVLDWRLPVHAYHRFFAAQVDSRCTAKEACQKMLNTGRYGPWEEGDDRNA